MTCFTRKHESDRLYSNCPFGYLKLVEVKAPSPADSTV